MPSVNLTRVQELYESACDFYDEVSDNARSFLDDIESKIDYCVEEEIGNVMLSNAQLSWLENLAEWDMHRNGNYD